MEGPLAAYHDGQMAYTIFGASYWDIPKEVKAAIIRIVGISKNSYVLDNIIQYIIGGDIFFGATDILYGYRTVLRECELDIATIRREMLLRSM